MCKSLLSCLSLRTGKISNYPDGTKHERRRLKKIFKELGVRCGGSQTAIDKDAFLKYIVLPGILGEQFFTAIDEAEDDKLDIKEFMESMLSLYKGSLNSVAWVLFKMLDFNKDGYITHGDMGFLLAHIPRKCNRCNKTLMIALDSAAKIDEFFAGAQKLHFLGFLDQLGNYKEICELLLNSIFNSLPAILDETFLPRDMLEKGCSRVVHAGWLKYKQRQYFFQLKNQSLYYSSLEETIADPTGIILIRDLFVESVRENTFKLRNSFFGYKFAAPSEDEKATWIACIKKATFFTDINEHYVILGIIGKGGFGKVRMGRHKVTGKEVAIKIIPKEPLDPYSETRLRREINILNMCKNKHLLRFEAVYETAELLYIVTEYVSGGTLYRWLKDRNFKTGELTAKRITRDIAEALRYLHSLGIIHRDLKLENILFEFNEDGEISNKLIDFGLSCMLGPGQYSQEGWGTLIYASPEVINKELYRESVDTWGLGIILHILLTGTIPFFADSSDEIARKILYDEINTDDPEWEGVSEEAKGIVKSLLRKNLVERASLQDLLEEEWFGATDEDVAVKLPATDSPSNPFNRD